MRAGCFIPLPTEIANKKACINPQNVDNEHCMLFAILAALHPQREHGYRPQNYERYLSEIKTSGIELPVRVIDVPKLERQNNFSINVYLLYLKKGKFESIEQSSSCQHWILCKVWLQFSRIKVCVLSSKECFWEITNTMVCRAIDCSRWGFAKGLQKYKTFASDC